MDELRPIPGFPGYSAARDGRIWSHPRRWKTLNGREASHAGRWLKSTFDPRRGYCVVTLSIGAARTNRTEQVHRLVALAWVPNDDPANKRDVNHLNGVKTANHAANLEWCTRARNIQHAYETGLRVVTARMREATAANGRSTRKLTPEQVAAIRSALASGTRHGDLAQQFHVCRQTISNIANGSTYQEKGAS